ncbi:DCL family protein [Kitasatospora sp. A2-31]|uniref:DCL family protein n=1 Tax=Kitasatospora sp. A2-31 TaxID=2916414 RepID=UPI001EECF127|nr:DCL family protein [Kitasatospora sp. A2-31]MCG6495679.1 DCL family protein [Kitasatospora sp. A2-31]
MAEFWIGPRRYKSKAAAGGAVREVLYRYTIGETVGQEEDELLLRDLLSLHRDADAKIGPGIESFRVVPTQLGSHQGFEAVRIDGTAIDFSYQKCLNPRTYPQRVIDALGVEAKDLRSAYFYNRQKEGTFVSDLSGAALSAAATDVSYFKGPSLASMAANFAAAAGDWDAIELTPATDPGLAVLVDRELAACWCEYHRKHAVLGLLSRAEHQRRPRK